MNTRPRSAMPIRISNRIGTTSVNSTRDCPRCPCLTRGRARAPATQPRGAELPRLELLALILLSVDKSLTRSPHPGTDGGLRTVDSTHVELANKISDRVPLTVGTAHPSRSLFSATDIRR